MTWTDQSVGIENLVATEIIVPPGGNPILASWDRPFFEITNPNAYPSTYGPVNSDNDRRRLVGRLRLVQPELHRRPRRLVGLGGIGLFHQRRPDLDEISRPTSLARARRSWAERSPPARRRTSSGRPADGNQPYYTLNGGTTWSPITLPGVTSWSDFDWAYYLDQRSVTADRVLANTFYLYDPGQGVFETTNGGASWTKVYSGYIESNSSTAGYNSSIQSVPGEASNLFYTGGPQRHDPDHAGE